MKCNVLKRALVLTALGASMATAAFAAPNGPVMIPQPGTVVVINHNPDVTFAGNINFDVESQENNNLKNWFYCCAECIIWCRIQQVRCS